MFSGGLACLCSAPTCSCEMVLPPLAKFIFQAERVRLLWSTLSEGNVQPGILGPRGSGPQPGRPLPAEAIWTKKTLSQELMKRKGREVRVAAERVVGRGGGAGGRAGRHSCFRRGTLTVEPACAGHTRHPCQAHQVQLGYLAIALS